MINSTFTRRAWLLFLGLPAGLVGADEQSYRLVIENHGFIPSELRVPANLKIKLIVENRDPTPEEFESYELNREKIIPGNSGATIYIGPLKPGRYPFFGEFNMATAQGAVIAE